jgi:hypothetical protein
MVSIKGSSPCGYRIGVGEASGTLETVGNAISGVCSISGKFGIIGIIGIIGIVMRGNGTVLYRARGR